MCLRLFWLLRMIRPTQRPLAAGRLNAQLRSKWSSTLMLVMSCWISSPRAYLWSPSHDRISSSFFSSRSLSKHLFIIWQSDPAHMHMSTDYIRTVLVPLKKTVVIVENFIYFHHNLVQRNSEAHIFHINHRYSGMFWSLFCFSKWYILIFWGFFFIFHSFSLLLSKLKRQYFSLPV